MASLFKRKNLPEGVDPSRIPPGQTLTAPDRWPLLHFGPVPKTDISRWDFNVFGAVENPLRLDYGELRALPSKEVVADIHCVTGWSRLGDRWTGVPIRDLLDARGVKGTFFLVGRALAARPDLARALVERGHLVANHSWRHDSKAWLDPRYPELARTQRAAEADLGVCPAFYRAPHGQHTPLLARVVHHHGLTMVGWDVSAGDWSAHDPGHLADRIVAEARPGSIIDLHDGLDGRVDADRTVLVAALPRILDGLTAKGLQPVRLDELLARPGYLKAC